MKNRLQTHLETGVMEIPCFLQQCLQLQGLHYISISYFFSSSFEFFVFFFCLLEDQDLVSSFCLGCPIVPVIIYKAVFSSIA